MPREDSAEVASLGRVCLERLSPINLASKLALWSVFHLSNSFKPPISYLLPPTSYLLPCFRMSESLLKRCISYMYSIIIQAREMTQWRAQHGSTVKY